MEKRIRELEALLERYRLAGRATNDPLWDWDVATGRVEWNEAVRTAFGYDSRELASLGAWANHVHPEDRARVTATLAAATEGDAESWTQEYRFRRSDGEYVTVLDRGFVARDEQGRAVRVIGTMVDITEQKRTEAHLAHSRSVLEAALESTTDGILVVDRRGQIAHFNRRFVEMWRIPEEIVESRDDDAAIAFVLHQLVDPEGFLAKVTELYATPDVESYDALEFRDGRIFERYSRPQRLDGEVIGRVWSFRDVTERRQIENQLREAQKMEALGRLAGGIAHDFNNLLTAIRGWAEMIQGDAAPGDPDGERAGEILEASDQAAALTRQLLALGRRQVLSPRLVRLDELLLEVEPLFAPLLGEDVRLEIRCDSDVWPVEVDPDSLLQVLMNLAVNAHDAMPEGGRLTIEGSSVELGPGSRPPSADLGPGRWVRLVVRDTGSGMDAATLSRAFEPFFTTKGRGTGLGLSTSYGIVHQSGGALTAESLPGEGSAFSIWLPGAPTPADEAPAASGAERPTPRPGGAVALVAEDEPRVRNLIRATLEQHGFQVIAAADGRAALEAAARSEGGIDFLVTDLVMPEMGGRELAQRLSIERPTLPVLFISGYTDQPFDRGLLATGRMAFLAKPFTPSHLVREVRALLGEPSPED